MTGVERLLKLGTRRSLLAWAQSSAVAREVERLNPGVRVELVGIETRGDQLLDVSLQKTEGKEFFVAELDEQLRAGAVDFTVHSMKDLSLDRPQEFRLAAVPERADPRDIAIFGPRALRKLAVGLPVRVGTSSPRRAENLGKLLSALLPRAGQDPARVEFVELRGNVNTRLSRVHEPDSSPKALDGVILALAGLERLHADEAARGELLKLLEGTRYQVLPLSENPTAPAQGALAIECRASDEQVCALLAKLHHEPTARAVAREREVLKRWGGGCHQKFGASAIELPFLGEILLVRGRRPDGSETDLVDWSPPILRPDHRAASISAADAGAGARRFQALGVEAPPPLGSALFIAHSRAVPESWMPALLHDASDRSAYRIWTAGTESWRKLAARGIWVEGCADGFGADSILRLLERPVLALPARKDWTILTHAGVEEGWSGWGARVVMSYAVEYLAGDAAMIQAFSKAEAVYWTSPGEWEAWEKYTRPGTRHAAGPGKTAATLRAAGVRVEVFPSKTEWKRWIQGEREYL